MSESCLIIAGEKSGEEHALSFLPTLMRISPETQFWGVGGDDMKDIGFESLYHLNDFSTWGFSEVLTKIPFYLNALNIIEKEALRRGTRTAVLIDYQDFNMKLGKRLSRHGIRVLHYVAPQAWAWKSWRAKVLAKTVHTLFAIIPFEKDWFKSRGVKRVVNIPHPILNYHGEKAFDLPERSFSDLKKEVRILLLPGSRKSEVSFLLPEFIETIKILKKSYPIKVGIVRSASVRPELYEPYQDFWQEEWNHKELSSALHWAHVSLAASGTVTLSCALFEVPTIVAYKASLFNEFIYHTFVTYRGAISLANIIHQKMLFPEFIQDRVNAYELAKQLEKWLVSEKDYQEIKRELRQTRILLKGEEVDVAEYIAKVIQSSHDEL